MKKLIALISLSCLVIIATAQTVNKNGTSTNTTNTQGKTTSNTTQTTKTPSRTTSPSQNTSPSVNQQKIQKSESPIKNEPRTANKPVKTVRFKVGNVMIKKTVEKEEQPSNESEKVSPESKGEIKKVAKSPEATDYVDRNKVSKNGSTDTTANNSSVENSTTTVNKYTPSINDKRSISCKDFTGMNNQQRQTILQGFESYDLSEIKVCNENVMKSKDKDDRLLVSCDEFSRSSDERKQHIINFPSFYNTEKLKNCEDYQKFISK